MTSWQAYFSQLGELGLTPTQLGRGPAWKRDAKPQIPASDLIAALTGQEPPAKPGTRPTKASLLPRPRPMPKRPNIPSMPSR